MRYLFLIYLIRIPLCFKDTNVLDIVVSFQKFHDNTNNVLFAKHPLRRE